jgi:hypothetical protein
MPPLNPAGGYRQFEKLVNHSIYGAVITDFNSKDNTFTVRYNDTPVLEQGCIWGAGVFSGMLGFNTNYVPPIGTQVIVAKGNPSVIVGARPSMSGNPFLNSENTVTGEKDLINATIKTETKEADRKSFDQTTIPGDLLPGEFDLSNVYGVALSMLNNLAKLSAGNLAAVECHLLSDMVRILSMNFKQHTAWGDIEFYNDGRLNLVINGTSYPHESFGAEKQQDQKFDASSSEGVKLDDIDAVNDTGRWRLSQYVGFLGNFIHTIISDPPAAIGSIAQEVFQAGKARVHVNNDGTILCQSVSDIVLERVTRIPVPRMKKRWEDGTGYKPEDFQKLEKKFLKVWNEKKENIHYTAYQLREYARYLSLFHSYSRFLQLSEGEKAKYELQSEADSPEPKRDNAEDDVKEANGEDLELFETYSTIRIMRDGSIVIWDGYGSSVVMSHGDIHHSAVKNVSIEAAGDVRIIAGQNLYVKARKNIEIVSVVGGLKLKARAWFHALCEWGSLLLKSDAIDKIEGETPPSPENEGDPEPIVGDAAIVLDATRGRTSLLSKHTIALEVDGTPDEDAGESDYSRSIILKSKHQHVKTFAFKSIYNEAKTGEIGLAASPGRSVIVRGARMQADVRNLIVNESINLGIGTSTIPSLLTSRIMCHGSIMAGNTSTKGTRPHDGHVYAKKPKIEVELRSQKSLEKVFEKLDEDNTSFNDVIAEDEKAFPTENYLKFKFEDFEAYVPEPEYFFQSPAQQYISLDHPDKTDKFEETNVSQERLKSADRNEANSAPFPGLNSKFKVYTKGEDLRTKSTSPPESFRPLDDKLDMTTQQYVFWKIKNTPPAP